MPRQSRSQNIGRAGERWFNEQLPLSWISQRPTEDVGVDYLVVICEEGLLNGLEFRVQVKSSENWKVLDNHIIYSNFPREKLIDLLIGFTPALLVFYELESKTGYCFWLNQILAKYPRLIKGTAKSVTIK
ncbi:MAG TPA: DUF4365 domain-containing protein, partial [Lamprocystis sp. (in: g-proteobacteria)]|nr:DUF4365 domain-containing protein [Lamprocystis sp. (in: g-proteobacteria)]